ncbi:MAG: hypothetical protein ACJ77B_12805 [Chloroflexota bacterium]
MAPTFAPAGALRTTQLTLKLHRFELVAFVVFGALGFVLAFVVGARLDALHFDARCADSTGVIQPPPACQALMERFYNMVNNEAGKVSVILTAVPFLGALLLGTPIVGREIERGTTRLAWALAPSRLRWFLQRLLPVLAIVAVGTFVLGIAADRLIRSTAPDLDPANSFAEMGARGAVLAARAVFVFALAVPIGAVMGRMLPALIVAGIVTYIGLSGGASVHQRILRSEAVPLDTAGPGDLQFDQRFRLPDGRLVTYDEVAQYDPPPTDPNFSGQWPTLPMVTIAVPGSRYHDYELREVAVLAGGSLVALMATALIISRRRPG